jgi:hypothetical protein
MVPSRASVRCPLGSLPDDLMGHPRDLGGTASGCPSGSILGPAGRGYHRQRPDNARTMGTEPPPGADAPSAGPSCRVGPSELSWDGPQPLTRTAPLPPDRSARRVQAALVMRGPQQRLPGEQLSEVLSVRVTRRRVGLLMAL